MVGALRVYLASEAAARTAPVHHVDGERPMHLSYFLLLGRQDRSEFGGQFTGAGALGAALLHRFAAGFHLGLSFGLLRFELLHLRVGEVEGIAHRAELVCVRLAAQSAFATLSALAAFTAFAAGPTGIAHRPFGTGEQLFFLRVGERRREGNGDGPKVAALGFIADSIGDERDLGVGEVEGSLEPLAAVGAILCRSHERK